MGTEIAPPVALCATCGCQCGGERVTVGWEYDRVARGELPVFRHAQASDCTRARACSDRFWSGVQVTERAA